MRVQAIVTVSVKMALPDGWGSDCSIKQVYDQAAAKAKNIMRQRIIDIPNATLHREVSVEAVITESE